MSLQFCLFFQHPGISQPADSVHVACLDSYFTVLNVFTYYFHCIDYGKSVSTFPENVLIHVRMI